MNLHLSTTLQRLLPLLAVVLALPSASAADVRLGVQGSICVPIGDLRDSANLGLQVGGFGAWDFRNGHGLLGRADLTFYEKKDYGTVASLGLGADYTYHLGRGETGAYVLAGISLQNYNPARPNRLRSESALGFGFDLGGGYDVNRNLGYQVRLTTVSIHGGNLASLNAGITYRF